MLEMAWFVISKGDRRQLRSSATIARHVTHNGVKTTEAFRQIACREQPVVSHAEVTRQLYDTIR